MNLHQAESITQKAKAQALATEARYKEAVKSASLGQKKARLAKLELKRAKKVAHIHRKAAKRLREASDTARNDFEKSVIAANKAEAKAAKIRKKTTAKSPLPKSKKRHQLVRPPAKTARQKKQLSRVKERAKNSPLTPQKKKPVRRPAKLPEMRTPTTSATPTPAEPPPSMSTATDTGPSKEFPVNPLNQHDS